MTIYAKLMEQKTDIGGYITYVFKVLDDNNIQQIGTNYLMCVRYPNWEHYDLQNGEIGYLNIKEVQAGIDKWFDGGDFHFYRYDDIVFLKFIKESPEITDKIIF